MICMNTVWNALLVKIDLFTSKDIHRNGTWIKRAFNIKGIKNIAVIVEAMEHISFFPSLLTSCARCCPEQHFKNRFVQATLWSQLIERGLSKRSIGWEIFSGAESVFNVPFQYTKAFFFFLYGPKNEKKLHKNLGEKKKKECFAIRRWFEAFADMLNQVFWYRTEPMEPHFATTACR